MKAVVLLLVLSLLLAVPSVGAARVGSGESAASLNLYFNIDLGIALSSTSFYMIPGPQLNIEQGIIVTLVLYATDNLTSHQVFIDMDSSGGLTVNDLISAVFISANPAYMSFALTWLGPKLYGDLVSLDTLYGVVNGIVPTPVPVPPPSNNTTVPPPSPPSWFRFDPFFIFGLMMELALVAYLGWLIVNFFRLRKLKKKLSDEDALKWSRAVMDPDTPARMNREQVLEYNRKDIVKRLRKLRPHLSRKKKA